MPEIAYDIHQPATQSTSVVFATPHSGRAYTRAFLARSALDPLALRSSEDAFVDRLIETAPRHGAPLLAARTPRAWVDFNRSQDELDPALIEGIDRAPLSPRLAAGLGVVPRVVSNGRAIYREKLSRAEAEMRLATAWRPYHGALHGLMSDTSARFGEVILIDMHSMPTEAIDAGTRGRAPRPQVVLGDRFGAAAGDAVVARIEAAFRRAGLRVARNTPFAGAFVAEHYGRPLQGWHVVQVELDRGLYMDERRVAPAAGFAAFQRLMAGIVAELAEIGAGGPAELPLAAE